MNILESVSFDTNYLQHVKEQVKDALKDLTTQKQKLSGLSLKKYQCLFFNLRFRKKCKKV